MLGLLPAGTGVCWGEEAPGDLPGATEISAPPKTRVPPKQPTGRIGADNGARRAGAGQAEADNSGVIGQARIKDIATVQGVRSNQLFGYGLVVGLEGTGDGSSSLFTISSIVNMLRRQGINVPIDQTRVKNVAAVMVTADLPAFAKEGSPIDVTVSSLGDAKSLQGGTLLQTPLMAANGNVYAAAQGALSIGGFNFEAGGSKLQKNHVNVGRIPRGGIVEKEVPTTLTDGSSIQITLREPDFTTASRMADAIRRQMPGTSALAMDAATVSVSLPSGRAEDTIGFLAQVETVRLTPDVQAKIVVNERTGTVVMGGNVRLAPGSIAHGAINIRVINTPIVVPAPPNSINAPPPLVVPLKDVEIKENKAQFAPITATTTVTQLVGALNGLGVTPRDLISILQAMHAAGMISAEIEVQ
jgi:flagellar P-ring protein precursor FlgI